MVFKRCHKETVACNTRFNSHSSSLLLMASRVAVVISHNLSSPLSKLQLSETALRVRFKVVVLILLTMECTLRLLLRHLPMKAMHLRVLLLLQLRTGPLSLVLKMKALQPLMLLRRPLLVPLKMNDHVLQQPSFTIINLLPSIF
jgi:hypothetical protein